MERTDLSEAFVPGGDYDDTDIIGEEKASSQTFDLSQLISPESRVLLHDDIYTVRQFLGKGNMGATNLAERVTGEVIEEYVIKYPFDSPVAYDSFETERAYHQKLHMSKPNLRHIARCIASGTAQVVSPEGVGRLRPVMILERLYENPYTFLGRGSLPLDIGIEMLAGMLYAVHEMNLAGIVHGDIAPKNLMCRPNIHVKRAEKAYLAGGKDAKEIGAKAIDRIRKYEYMIANGEFQPVLIDFGCASNRKRQLEDGEQIVGTLAYMPKEAVKKGDMGPKRDVYATMVSMVEMILGVRPYAHLTSERKSEIENFQTTMRAVLCGRPAFDDLYKQVQALEPHFKVDYSASKLAKNLYRIFSGGLSHKPGERLDTRDLLDDLFTSFEITESTFTDCTGQQCKRFRQGILVPTAPERVREIRKENSAGMTTAELVNLRVR